jgi:hypothetical protein
MDTNENSNVKDTSKYVILQEYNDKKSETWLYFIKYDSNKKALEYLEKQLNSINWVIMKNLSTFDIDLNHFVSATTAKEMTKIELNAYQWHRKFDGTLRMINMKLKEKDDDEDKILKVYYKLGKGMIEKYIGYEDIDQEDKLNEGEKDDWKEDSEDTFNTDDETDDTDDTDNDEDDDDTDDTDDDTDSYKKRFKLPPSLLS